MSLVRNGLWHWLGVVAVMAVMTLSACATRTPAPQAADTLFWSGRMALSIANTPAQSFSAGFELKSQAQTGELQLLSPLGASLAKLQWAPGQARLEQGGQVWLDTSLDALLIRLTGSALPLSALIDWLQARPTSVAGWNADLSQIGSGKLAVQSAPSGTNSVQPQVTLRLILEP